MIDLKQKIIPLYIDQSRTTNTLLLTIIVNGIPDILDVQLQKYTTNSIIFNSFPGMALQGRPPKGVLYWGGYNLVNFSSLVPPLRLSLCSYLVLFDWCFILCVKILYLFR